MQVEKSVPQDNCSVLINTTKALPRRGLLLKERICSKVSEFFSLSLKPLIFHLSKMENYCFSSVAIFKHNRVDPY